MLAAFRAFAKSWVAILLIGLLIVAFAVFGIRDVFGHRMSTAVIEAGSRKISSAEFRREFEQLRRRAEEQSGQPVTVEMAAQAGLDRRVLQGLATREAFAELLQRMGVQPSDALVAREIAKMPAFANPVSGRFDKQLYQQRLAQSDLTPARFEGLLRDELSGQFVATALSNAFQAPRAYAALGALYALESRDVVYLTVTPAGVPQPAMPTDAQLTAFMKEISAQLTRPEFRVLTVVRFSPELVAANIAVDPAELKKRYEFRKDTLSTPETRSLVQIPAKDAAAAQAVAARLQRGEAPGAIAKSLGVDAISYENKPQTAIPDRKLAAAAFKLQSGQVSVVQGDLGLAVVKVGAVTPGTAVTFEQAKPGLEAELRKDAAAEKVYALTQAYDDAHQKGANLTEAAQKAGVAATTLGPVTRDGRDQQAQPLNGLSKKLLDTAFGLPAGGESEVVEAGNGEYFAVRVEKVIPPALPSLAEIRPQLTRAWVMRQLGDAMTAKAEALAARVRKGESLDAVAASAGAPVTRAPGVDRRTAEQNPLMTPDILGQVFGGKPGDVFTARGRQGFVVGKIEAVRTGDTDALATVAAQVRPQMTETLFNEIGAAAQGAARQKLKAKVDYARARAAIGLEPADAKGKAEPAK